MINDNLKRVNIPLIKTFQSELEDVCYIIQKMQLFDFPIVQFHCNYHSNSSAETLKELFIRFNRNVENRFVYPVIFTSDQGCDVCVNLGIDFEKDMGLKQQVAEALTFNRIMGHDKLLLDI